MARAGSGARLLAEAAVGFGEDGREELPRLADLATHDTSEPADRAQAA